MVTIVWGPKHMVAQSGIRFNSPRTKLPESLTYRWQVLSRKYLRVTSVYSMHRSGRTLMQARKIAQGLKGRTGAGS